MDFSYPKATIGFHENGTCTVLKTPRKHKVCREKEVTSQAIFNARSSRLLLQGQSLPHTNPVIMNNDIIFSYDSTNHLPPRSQSATRAPQKLRHKS